MKPYEGKQTNNTGAMYQHKDHKTAHLLERSALVLYTAYTLWHWFQKTDVLSLLCFCIFDKYLAFSQWSRVQCLHLNCDKILEGICVVQGFQLRGGQHRSAKQHVFLLSTECSIGVREYTPNVSPSTQEWYPRPTPTLLEKILWNTLGLFIFLDASRKILLVFLTNLMAPEDIR